MSAAERIRAHLLAIYGPESLPGVHADLRRRLESFRANHPDLAAAQDRELSERDAFVIAYGDQLRKPAEPPLRTLGGFLLQRLGGVLRGVHILPFFPYSSDDGFAVIDYRRVDPALGDWTEIEFIARRLRLMVDGVFNHISSASAWFQGYLRDEPPYRSYFLEIDPERDLSAVFRPRPGPPYTLVVTPRGERRVWTTFSADQIDLNFAEPRVLLEIVDVLLLYVEKGARLIRLDAIAFLWKEPGTRCLHHPKTHHIVKLLRAILDEVAPCVLLITETNVPHEENISYFGRLREDGGGSDEASLVYQFPLAPLALHAFASGDARALTRWARTLPAPNPHTTFFNFMASHDGIGLVPARGLLLEEEIEALVRLTLTHGGEVSTRRTPGGGESPYELNITLYDALNNPAQVDLERDIARFMASQVILLSLAGVPGIYFHSLLGSRCWREGFEREGRARLLNREKPTLAEVEARLRDPRGHCGRVFASYRHLLRQRIAQPAFHPAAGQEVLELHPALFALVRRPRAGFPLLVLVNVAPTAVHLEISPPAHELPCDLPWFDLIAAEAIPAAPGAPLHLTLPPFGARWLLPAEPPQFG